MAAPLFPIRDEIEFGPYRVNGAERLLTRNGEAVHLPPKTFDLLLVLLSNRGHLVQKAELRRLVWPDTFVDDVNLAQHVSVLRRALRDGEEGCRFIETVPRLGYRFREPVRAVDAVSAPSSSVTLARPDINKNDATVVPSLFQQRGTMALAGALAVMLAAATLTPLFWATKLHRAAPAVQATTQAEQNYREGRFFWEKRTADDYRAAIAHFEEAVRLKPNYADAYAGLADSYILLGSFGVEPLGEVIPKARAAAVRAVEIDERSSEAHAALGYIMSRFEWNWDEADREFKRAIELDPRNTTAHHWYALHLITMGSAAEAIAEIRRAQALDPGSLILNTDTALVLFYARRYDDAIQQARNVVRADPSFGLAHRTLGEIYAAKGMYRDALTELSRASKLLGTDPWTIAESGRCHALLGEREQAVARFDQLQDLAKQRFVSPSAFALLSAALEGKRDQSFEWLEREYDAHSNVALLAVYPGFDSIRDDPRFQKILERVGLPHLQ